MSNPRGDGLVIGVTGPIGSGVTTVASYLGGHGFKRLRLSDPIKAEYRTKHGLSAETAISERTRPGSRRELQDIGDSGRKTSPSHWVDRIFETESHEGDLVIEGIRNLAEVDALRARFHRFFLVAVHAARASRWDRTRSTYDGNEKSFDIDDRRDQGGSDPSGQQVGKCVQEADYVLNNDEPCGPTARDNRLHDLLAPDVELMRAANTRQSRTGLRPPTPEEGHMAAAYAESHISRCIKRHVGAVIVDMNGRPLSLGYNENPFGMPPCVTQFNNSCFKDDDMHDKLAKKSGVYCPTCGKQCSVIESPWRCPYCRDDLKLLFFPDRNLSLCTAIHAEERAILSLEGRSADGATLYTTTFPCFYCARKIIDASIAKVVFVEAYPIVEAYKFLRDREVVVEPFQGFKARAFNLVFRQME